MKKRFAIPLIISLPLVSGVGLYIAFGNGADSGLSSFEIKEKLTAEQLEQKSNETKSNSEESVVKFPNVFDALKRLY